MTPTESLVRAIHELPHKTVLAITGGGAEAIGELLRHGNGSKTLIEGVVPYDQHAFDDFVKGTPDKYCSAGAARDLAMAAYIRAGKLAGGFDNIVGIGASCSLVKDGGERPGRKHLVYVACQTGQRTGTHEFEITHDIPVTREAEETFAAEKILNILAEACELGLRIPESLPNTPKIDGISASRELGQLVRGEISLLSTETQTKDMTPWHPVQPGTRRYILAGAFNPVHERHLDMAKTVHRLKGDPVDFELCIRNVDKTPLNFHDLHERRAGLEKTIYGQPWAGHIHFTTAPTFTRKAELFPNSTFIVGFDTFKRIGDPKYYDGDETKKFQAIERLRLLNCRFLVFHRIYQGECSTGDDVAKLYPPLVELAEIVPESELPPSAMSSSEIRKSS